MIRYGHPTEGGPGWQQNRLMAWLLTMSRALWWAIREGKKNDRILKEEENLPWNLGRCSKFSDEVGTYLT